MKGTQAFDHEMNTGGGDCAGRAGEAYLTESVYYVIFKSQFSHKIVNLLFIFAMRNGYPN